MKIIHLKAVVAALIPAGAAFLAAWDQFVKLDSWPSGPQALLVSVSVVMAGASGLGSFLSTSFADHKAETDQQPLTAKPADTMVSP